jgi:lipase
MQRHDPAGESTADTMTDAGLVLPVTRYGDPSGRPLLAVHGITDTKATWAKLAADGLPERQWICVDLRGHGDAPGDRPWTLLQNAHDVLATVDSLGLDRVDMIGHSFGGRVSAVVANHAPHRVESLMLLDPRAMSHDEAADFHRAQYSAPYPTYRSHSEIIAQRTEGLRVAARVHAEHDGAMAKYRHGADGRIYLRANEQIARVLLTEMNQAPCPSLEAFPGTVLLLKSATSGVVTESGLSLLAAQLGTRLTVATLEAGHYLWWEAFDETVTHVRDFLERRR